MFGQSEGAIPVSKQNTDIVAIVVCRDQVDLPIVVDIPSDNELRIDAQLIRHRTTICAVMFVEVNIDFIAIHKARSE